MPLEVGVAAVVRAAGLWPELHPPACPERRRAAVGCEAGVDTDTGTLPGGGQAAREWFRNRPVQGVRLFDCGLVTALTNWDTRLAFAYPASSPMRS